MRISDWSSDVCSSDLQTSEVNTYTDAVDTIVRNLGMGLPPFVDPQGRLFGFVSDVAAANGIPLSLMGHRWNEKFINTGDPRAYAIFGDLIWHATDRPNLTRSAEQTSDLQSLMPN